MMKKRKIKDIYTANITGVSLETPIEEAMAKMRMYNISCVVVLKENLPVGIITERDLVSFGAKWGKEGDHIPVSELMSSPVLTVHREADIYDAYSQLFSHNIRHLVVIDDDRMAVGILTQSNIVEYLRYDSFVEMKRVSQVMSKVVFTLPSDENVNTALRDMSEKLVSCLVVVEKHRPIGILTERDVAKLLLGGQDLSQLNLADVMSESVNTVFGETPLLDAVRLMKRKKIRHLVVVNHQGGIEGLATQTDVVKGLEGKYIETLNRIIAEKDNVIKSTSAELLETTIYLENILNSAIDYGIFALSLDYRIVYFNTGAENVLGILAVEVSGSNVREIRRRKSDGDDLFRIDEVVSVLKENKSHSYTIERRNKTNLQYIQTRASKILDLNGNLIGYLFMFNDITQRKLAEMQLLQSQEMLEEKVRDRTRELENAMNGAIQAMALTVEMRDPYTSGHQRRVATLAVAIAKEMRLSPESVEGIYMAGLIHDIGKIRVPSGILCYPGALRTAEQAIIRAHPETGYDILKGIEFPWPIAETVLQHHEKMNGEGYPRGLKGDEISLKARILMVADVVEAMSSHRPYRPALGIQVALEEITTNRGKYYDPKVVDACLDLFHKKKYELPPSFQYVGS